MAVRARHYRHGRARPGHPRLSSSIGAKTWMPGTRLRRGFAGPRTRLAGVALGEDGKAGHDELTESAQLRWLLLVALVGPARPARRCAQADYCATAGNSPALLMTGAASGEVRKRRSAAAASTSCAARVSVPAKRRAGRLLVRAPRASPTIAFPEEALACRGFSRPEYDGSSSLPTDPCRAFPGRA